jgi:hypothetical protein
VVERWRAVFRFELDAGFLMVNQKALDKWAGPTG